jgi:hypothetical protein
VYAKRWHRCYYNTNNFDVFAHGIVFHIVIDEAGHQNYPSKTAFMKARNKGNGEIRYIEGIYAGRNIQEAYEIEQAMNHTSESSINTTPNWTTTGVLEPLPLQAAEDSALNTLPNGTNGPNSTPAGTGGSFKTDHRIGHQEFVGEQVATQEQLIELVAERIHPRREDGAAQHLQQNMSIGAQFQHQQLQAQLEASMFCEVTATEVMSGSGGGTNRIC